MNTQVLHNLIALGEGFTTEFKHPGPHATQRGHISDGNQAPHKSPPKSPPKSPLMSPPKSDDSRRRFPERTVPDKSSSGLQRYRLTELGRHLSDR